MAMVNRGTILPFGISGVYRLRRDFAGAICIARAGILDELVKPFVRCRRLMRRCVIHPRCWHAFGSVSDERTESMKSFLNSTEFNAKTKLSFALCTALALSGVGVRGADKDNTGTPENPASRETGKAARLSHGDESFIKDAAKGGMMEVEMGQLGVQKAQSSELKQFAQRLIDDHTKANAELKQLAASKGVTLPEPSDSHITGAAETKDRTQAREKSDTDHQLGFWDRRELKKLQGLSGTDFDREFVKMAVNDHEKDVKEFEKASQNLDDSELKAFAAKTLPALQQHLSQAKSLQTTVNAGAPGADSGADIDKSKSSTGDSKIK
jgi:putative membrane protein